ncbi:GntR family transcriptional regulator [Rhodococcus sp. C3V]|uniref:GntR family transcriptional regulator n=1 Tax=Rhodococcus sp. C3V TaxID=3034165 RepID=UPI0023E24745|nr:GntR family transcriptional regulator [Rhodococcus sp. C3V]MDF3319950.1 GntR family transcriptional regulator [Rhodococcus sp. C3V]
MTTTPQAPGQAAYSQIRQAIVEGRYRPGQRLIEQRIAEQFSLSRTPVREALRRLEAEGLVLSEPNRGAIVRTLSIADVSDLYGLRARLEAYAAELAADRIDLDTLGLLDAGIDAFARALTATTADLVDRVRAVDTANSHIHRAIMSAAKHERLSRLLERTTDVPLVFQAFRQYDRAQTERSHLFHQLIRDAIVASDGPRASALMHEHVLQGRDVLLAHLAATDSDEVAELFGTSTREAAGASELAGNPNSEHPTEPV